MPKLVFPLKEGNKVPSMPLKEFLRLRKAAREDAKRKGTL